MINYVQTLFNHVLREACTWPHVHDFRLLKKKSEKKGGRLSRMFGKKKNEEDTGDEATGDEQGGIEKKNSKGNVGK